MKKKCSKFFRCSIAAVLTMSLITGLAPVNTAPVRNVKEAKAAALTFQVGEGSATAPAFNSANFPTFDKDSGNTEYYFGKTGNAFYGVGSNGAGFTNSMTWELVDTDTIFGTKVLKSVWSDTNSNNGQKILDYTNGLTNTYFSTADQKAMKSQSVAIDTYSDNSVAGVGSIDDATLWPISVRQAINGGTAISDSTRAQVTDLIKKLIDNSGSDIWTRSYKGDGVQNAWSLSSENSGASCSYSSSNCQLRVSPAFALDLEQVLMTRDATSDKSQTSLALVNINNGNLKFLLNVGSEKSNFNVPAINGKKLLNVQPGKTYQFNYSDASTSQLNSGINYVSAIIYDSTGRIMYYGNLDTISSATGTAQITIPSNLIIGQDYTIALFQEEKCDEKLTDYASTPIYSSFRVEPSAGSFAFQVEDASVSSPSFKAANFPTFDVDSGNTEYYFGKDGNAFYGVSCGASASGKYPTGFTNESTWEMIDTDASIPNLNTQLKWDKSGNVGNCDLLIDLKNNVSSAFSAADQAAMKELRIGAPLYAPSNRFEGSSTTTVTTKLWTMDATQMMTNGKLPTLSSDSCPPTLLAKKLHNNVGATLWTRSCAGRENRGSYQAWNIKYNTKKDRAVLSYGFATTAFKVAPSIALDLTKVLKTKPYNKGYKFLVNTGSNKCSFDIPAIRGKRITNVCKGKQYEFNYSGATTSNLNGGVNYLSAIIYGNNGKIAYYDNFVRISKQSGIASFKIPDTLIDGEDYTLALFEEEVCDGGKTDYASEPVYASFTVKDKNTLTYDVTTNGGTSSALSSIEVEPDTVFDSASGVFDKTASKPGWTFVGWNTDRNAHTGLTSLTMNSDKTLYAIFKKDLIITFKDVGN